MLETQTTQYEQLKAKLKTFYDEYGDDLVGCFPEAEEMLYELMKDHNIDPEN